MRFERARRQLTNHDWEDDDLLALRMARASRIGVGSRVPDTWETASDQDGEQTPLVVDMLQERLQARPLGRQRED